MSRVRSCEVYLSAVPLGWESCCGSLPKGSCQSPRDGWEGGTTLVWRSCPGRQEPLWMLLGVGTWLHAACPCRFWWQPRCCARSCLSPAGSTSYLPAAAAAWCCSPDPCRLPGSPCWSCSPDSGWHEARSPATHAAAAACLLLHAHCGEPAAGIGFSPSQWWNLLQSHISPLASAPCAALPLCHGTV